MPDMTDDKVAQEVVAIATGQKQPEEKPVEDQNVEASYHKNEGKL